jgi:zinc/manganese transport system substrate-binding protein
MMKLLKIILILLVVFNSFGFAEDKIKIVTTLTDLESIAQLIGGDKVDVFAIAKGYQNPHFVDPKPSYILKLSRADMFVTVGLDLEIGWVPPLLNSARNANIVPGSPGYVDASKNIKLLQVPSKIDKSEGDIHIYGNPHYWLGPSNGKTIAENIYIALVNISPENTEYFTKNLNQFKDTIDKKLVEWEKQMEPFKGSKIIAYHNEWPYFEEEFGLNIVDFLEPKPGIPPTPSQLAKVISRMTSEKISIIINSPYFQAKSADLVARKTNGQVVTLATSVGAFESIKNYYDLFDYNIDVLSGAFKEISK